MTEIAKSFAELMAERQARTKAAVESDKPKHTEHTESARSLQTELTKTTLKTEAKLPDLDSLDLESPGQRSQPSEQARKKTEPTKPTSKPEPSVEAKSSGKSDPVVTQDGRTLNEVLTGIRGGSTPLKTLMQKIDTGELAVEVNGKTKPDGRYTKYVEGLNKKEERDKARIKASKRFMQKNTRYTEEEKRILRNLGLTPNQFVKVLSRKSNLTKHDKQVLLSYGARGTAQYFRGKRFNATVGDFDILQFLAKFKICNTQILSRIKGENTGVTRRKLTRLKERGLVAERNVIGAGTLWLLTEAGMALSGYNLKTDRAKKTKETVLPPVIGANHIAACLWNNTHNILNLDDFPAKNRKVYMNGKETLVQGETLVSEYEIRSSLGKHATPDFVAGGSESKNMYNAVGEVARQEFYEWEQQGKKGESPEFEFNKEYRWVLFPDSLYTDTYHVPDLVVARPRNSDGSPNSIAVELELTQKTPERYTRILMAYKLDKTLYSKVIWLTSQASIANSIAKVADEIGLENFDVVPLTNENGLYKGRDIWHI